MRIVTSGPPDGSKPEREPSRWYVTHELVVRFIVVVEPTMGVELVAVLIWVGEEEAVDPIRLLFAEKSGPNARTMNASRIMAASERGRRFRRFLPSTDGEICFFVIASSFPLDYIRG